MLPQHLAMMVMVQILWGANFAVAKFGLDDFSPIFFVALRFSLVAVLLIFVVGLPRRDKLLRLLPLSVTMGVMHFTLMFLGMSRLDAATSSIAVQLQTPFAAIMAASLSSIRFAMYGCVRGSFKYSRKRCRSNRPCARSNASQ